MLVLSRFGTEGQVTAWFCFSGFLTVGDGAWPGLLWVPMHTGAGHRALERAAGHGTGAS